jgi:hypothetical protein
MSTSKTRTERTYTGAKCTPTTCPSFFVEFKSATASERAWVEYAHRTKHPNAASTYYTKVPAVTDCLVVDGVVTSLALYSFKTGTDYDARTIETLSPTSSQTFIENVTKWNSTIAAERSAAADFHLLLKTSLDSDSSNMLLASAKYKACLAEPHIDPAAVLLALETCHGVSSGFSTLASLQQVVTWTQGSSTFSAAVVNLDKQFTDFLSILGSDGSTIDAKLLKSLIMLNGLAPALKPWKDSFFSTQSDATSLSQNKLLLDPSLLSSTILNWCLHTGGDLPGEILPSRALVATTAKPSAPVQCAFPECSVRFTPGTGKNGNPHRYCEVHWKARKASAPPGGRSRSSSLSGAQRPTALVGATEEQTAEEAAYFAAAQDFLHRLGQPGSNASAFFTPYTDTTEVDAKNSNLKLFHYSLFFSLLAQLPSLCFLPSLLCSARPLRPSLSPFTVGPTCLTTLLSLCPPGTPRLLYIPPAPR